MYPLAIVLAALAATPAQNKSVRYYLKTADAKSVVGTLSYDITAEKVQATEWVVFAGLAPELPGQTKVKTTMSPAGATVTELSPLGRKLLMSHVKATTTDQKSHMPVTVTYSATLRSRMLVPLGGITITTAVAGLPDKERKQFLSEFGDCDFTSPAFKKWLKDEDLTRRDSESDIDFARRVFLAIRSKFRYEYKAELERHASAVCTAGKSDCGGLSILFVAVMRANEIPARSLYGRWAQSAKPGDKADGAAYYQWHVKAEFFATGVGWVPIDMAGAIVHDKSFVGLEFFGKDKGDFITFHIDPNLTVDTKVSGQQTLVGLQRPAYWVRGLGTFDQHKEVEDWKVK